MTNGLDLDAGDNFGSAISSLGDRDGDGVQDIVVGTPFDDDIASNKGAIYMIQLEAVKGPGGVIDGLQAWFDPAQGVSIEGEIGTDPDVTSWTDRSVNGYSVDQQASASRPGFVNQALNGNPALEFDGTSDFLDTLSTPLTGDDNGTIFAVASRDTGVNAYGAILGFGIGASAAPMMTHNTTNGFGIYHNGSSPLETYHSDSIEFDQTYVYDVSWTNGIDQSSTIGVDGVEESSSTMDITSIEQNFFTIGSDQGSLYEWDGFIGEVIIYDRVLTGSDAQKVRSYMSVKYGTTLSG